jgi:glycosyltransferase involved in cell wall biosynthesis
VNVVLLANGARIGGGNRSLLLLAQALQTRKIRPLVICPADGDMVDLTTSLGIDCHVLPFVQPGWTSPVATWTGLRSWMKLLERSSADVLHANGLRSYRSAATAARLSGIPSLCHVRFPASASTIRWVFRWIPQPAAIIFNSNALFEECGPHFAKSAPRAALHVVHNAVDVATFVPGPVRTGRPLRIGILANFVAVKGHADFVAMAALLTAQGTDAEYVVAGYEVLETGLGAAMEQLVATMGLERRFRFLGHVKDVPALLRTLDIVVSSSHVEPFGRSVLEAMACQVPVVATRVGGVPEVVEDERTGLLVPPRDPYALAAAVTRLAEDPELRRTLGQRGRARAIQQFSVEAHVDNIITLYANATRSGRSR